MPACHLTVTVSSGPLPEQRAPDRRAPRDVARGAVGLVDADDAVDDARAAVVLDGDGGAEEDLVAALLLARIDHHAPRPAAWPESAGGYRSRAAGACGRCTRHSRNDPLRRRRRRARSPPPAASCERRKVELGRQFPVPGRRDVVLLRRASSAGALSCSGRAMSAWLRIAKIQREDPRPIAHFLRRDRAPLCTMRRT